MRGFSLVELVFSVAIVIAVAAAVFRLVGPSRRVFESALQQAETHQRIRASMEWMFRDLVMAGAGLRLPAVAPFRRGLRTPDAPGTARADRVSVSYVPRDSTLADAVTATYWTRAERNGSLQLMRYDGRDTDLPMTDLVTSLRFEYFADGDVPLPYAAFTDGPWLPSGELGSYDGDLLLIRRVRVILRVQSARELLGIPRSDREARFDVALRNLNLP
jgi:type II secretory pathway pseudopilin PulG